MALSRCSSCDRFVLPETEACPFCGGHSLLRAAVVLAGALALGACDKEAAPADSGATTKSSNPDAPDPQMPAPPDEPDAPDTPDARPDLGNGDDGSREPVRAIYAGPPPRPGSEEPKPAPSEPEAAPTPDAPTPE